MATGVTNVVELYTSSTVGMKTTKPKNKGHLNTSIYYAEKDFLSPNDVIRLTEIQ